MGHAGEGVSREKYTSQEIRPDQLEKIKNIPTEKVAIEREPHESFEFDSDLIIYDAPNKNQDFYVEQPEFGMYGVFDGRFDEGKNYSKSLAKIAGRLAKNIKPDMVLVLWEKAVENFFIEFEKEASISVPIKKVGIFKKKIQPLGDSTSTILFFHSSGEVRGKNRGDSPVYFYDIKTGLLKQQTVPTSKIGKDEKGSTISYPGGYSGENQQPSNNIKTRIGSNSLVLLSTDGWIQTSYQKGLRPEVDIPKAFKALGENLTPKNATEAIQKLLENPEDDVTLFAILPRKKQSSAAAG